MHFKAVSPELLVRYAVTVCWLVSRPLASAPITNELAVMLAILSLYRYDDVNATICLRCMTISNIIYFDWTSWHVFDALVLTSTLSLRALIHLLCSHLLVGRNDIHIQSRLQSWCPCLWRTSVTSFDILALITIVFGGIRSWNAAILCISNLYLEL